MATISSTLVLEDRMTKTLNNIDKACNSLEKSMKSVANSLSTVDGESQKASKGMQLATSSSKGLLKSLLGFSVIKNLFSMIMGQVGSAIQRFDTLNNYVNVMDNLGIGSEEAQYSINRLKTALDGLPTTLQDAVTSVQRFASANNNVKASTEMFLALNNAILAGGGSAMTQASALEQLSQAYAKGKPDMMEWRTAMTAMPAQLSQVAKVMGFVNATELGESLRKGTTSMNEFMKTLVKMNNESVDGFKSLEEQARNATGGIQTAITNFKTSITKGLTDMIESINTALAESGLPSIQELIITAGKKIQEVLVQVGYFVGKVIGFIATNWETIKPILITILGIMAIYQVSMVALNAVTTIYNAVTTISEMVTTGFAASLWSVVWPILLIISAILIWIGYVLLLTKIVESVTNQHISAVGLIAAWFNILKAFIYNRFIVPVWNVIASLVNFFANCFKNPVEATKILFLDMSVNILGYFISLVKGIEDLLNPLIDKFNELTHTSMGHINVSGTLQGFSDTFSSNSSVRKANMGWEEVAQTLNYEQYSDAAAAGAAWGNQITDSVVGALNPASWGLGSLGLGSNGDSSDILGDIGEIDWDSLNNIGNTVGTDGTGGRALKTTTKDDLKISDEDIQLLLDVATRDYKLNYQKVEPNITITFGDIRETADVDNILDKVADKLEEIYDSNLEVSNG